jgi:hypothetical protein
VQAGYKKEQIEADASQIEHSLVQVGYKKAPRTDNSFFFRRIRAPQGEQLAHLDSSTKAGGFNRAI